MTVWVHLKFGQHDILVTAMTLDMSMVSFWCNAPDVSLPLRALITITLSNDRGLYWNLMHYINIWTLVPSD